MDMIPKQVIMIANIITQAGGRALLVGGAVIDMIQKREPKDWDLEVFRMSYDQLKELLSEFKPKTCGQAFGVLKLSVEGLDFGADGERLLADLHAGGEVVNGAGEGRRRSRSRCSSPCARAR